MNIHTQAVNGQSGRNERHVQLSRGDIVEAKITDRKSDREAVVSIRGQKMTASFDNGVPAASRASIEITGKTEEGIRVRVITEAASSSSYSGGPSVEKTLSKLGIKDPSPEFRAAAERFLTAGAELTKENVRELQQYVERGQGTVNQRMETIDQAARRQLEPVRSHLLALHQSLHEKALNTQIQEMKDAKSTTSRIGSFGEIIENLRSKIRNSQAVEGTIQNLKRALLEQNLHGNHQRSISELTQRITSLIQSGKGLDALNLVDNLANVLNKSNNVFPVTAVGHMQNALVNEPSLKEAVSKIRELAHSSLTTEQRTFLEGQIIQAETFTAKGRELKARQVVAGALEALSSTSLPAESSGAGSTRPDPGRYLDNDFLSTLPVTSKDYVVTTVSERMALATDDFKLMQRDVSRQLDRIAHIMMHVRTAAQAKPMLETVIHQLDKALMKSDWLLFADMKTERRMLEASSQLTRAKELIARGEHHSARQLIKEVQQTVNTLNFKPADTKVKHFASQQAEWHEKRPVQDRLNSYVKDAARSLVQNDHSGRQVFEGIRQLGYSRESEIARILAAGKGNIEEANQKNVRGLLLQMIKSDEESGRNQAQQVLMTSTGQQLLARSDSQHSNLQSLLLQLPVLLEGQTENLQVFINGRNKYNDQLDWENCNLYFLMETKKLGEIGISLQVTNRTLNITLKNDLPGFKHKLEPFTKACLKRLEQVGYTAGDIHFKPLHDKDTPAVPSKKITPQATQKGFDYKI
ncbi:hypothetical protein JSY36_16030 [Bacillus sp. H-16]|uniref:hypothetical protein n=1 Tax=Alteribacter salitolerans TaxID=2912333 RepID=UPI001962E0DD|nr:hypothetical protein [Alteribacter salitolerans]MBM7097242.1 hypothetical protein [Alteribacter salitolerans]